jgi:hypothetical protein
MVREFAGLKACAMRVRAGSCRPFVCVGSGEQYHGEHPEAKTDNRPDSPRDEDVFHILFPPIVVARTRCRVKARRPHWFQSTALDNASQQKRVVRSRLIAARPFAPWATARLARRQVVW